MTFVKTALFHKAGEGSGGGGGGSDPHNLGFYADLTALQTAHPTGSDGDFAILGSTDTVWVWDSGTSAWKDTDTKGQVTSVNGQTGAVVIPDELPSQTGNSGKFLTTDGTDASWAAVGALPDQTGQSGKFLTTDGTDASWGSEIINNVVILTGVSTNVSAALILRTSNVNNGAQFYYNNGTNQVELLSGTTNPASGSGRTLAVGKLNPIGNQQTLGGAGQWSRWLKTYTQNLNSGNTNAGDIIVPDVAGTMAVIQVNSTITLTAAGWSSNSQTVTVTGMTADGVVMVSPDPTDQSAYTSAGILCTAQAAGTLTFTCDTVPSADIDVNVVML